MHGVRGAPSARRGSRRSSFRPLTTTKRRRRTTTTRMIDPQPSASRHLKPSRDCYVTAKPKGIINRTRSRRSKRWHRSSSPLRRASHTPRDSREIAIPRDEHTPDQLWTETEICSKISARAQAKAPPSRSVPDSAGWMRKPKERLQSEERAKQRLRTGGVILRGNNQGISG